MKLGDGDKVLAPLTLGQLRRLEADIAAINGMMPADLLKPDGIDRVVRIVQASLSRNYPEVAEKDVEEWIDLGNMSQAMSAVMGVSGIKKAETPPAKPAEAGRSSIATSSPPPDGPGNTSTNA